MKFRVRLREMASDEIYSMIEPERLRQIKTQDPKPLFKAFVVGHEGQARGNMVGIGNIVKTWYRNAIAQLHEKIAAGLQLFHGHQAGTNDSAGRQAIGEVVGKRAMRIGDRLSSVVACYIYPSFRHLPLDVASIEAEVTMEKEAGRGLYVAEVDRVTGIALGNSSVNTPGFEGATLLGQLQAFAAKEKIGDLMDLTLEDVQAFLKQEKLRPSDVYSPAELEQDPFVSEKTKEKSPSNLEFARMRKELSTAEKRLAEVEREKASLDEKVKTQDAEIASARVESAKGKLGPLFEKQKADRKLDDRQTKFIQERLPRFTPSKPDELDKEFNSYLDSEIDEYGKIAKVFGIEPAKVEGKLGDKGTQPENHPAGPAAEKYVDPARNPMIKLA